MIDTSELLRAYLGAIRIITTAATVSIYVPASRSGLARAILIHDGDGPPLPELASFEAAAAFIARPDILTPQENNARCLNLVTSANSEGRLMALPSPRRHGVPDRDEAIAETRRHSERGQDRATRTLTAWLGLRFHQNGAPFDVDDAGGRFWAQFVELGGALSFHTSQISAILKDPLTGLPDRAEFQAVLAEEFERFVIGGVPLSLLFVNPDDFTDVNEQLGRGAGDRAILEISQRLPGALRSSDSLARYGGVTFAVVLPDTSLETAKSVARELLPRLTEGAYLDGALRLGFSVGVAETTPTGEIMQKPFHLIRRADKALHAAKRQGGASIADWMEGAEDESGTFDRLVGMFTGNMRKDYRNMVLLWETVNVIAANDDPEITVTRVVGSLYETFKPEYVGLVDVSGESNGSTMRGLARESFVASEDLTLQTLAINARQTELVNAALTAREPRHEAQHDASGARLSYAIPLVAGDVTCVCLYIEGFEGVKSLDSSDVFFLKALGKQLAVALDRSRLAARERARRERDERRLRAELNELREAVQQTKLTYRSEKMEKLLAKARTVAPTDATVLITGESGTGKELLAHTIHKLSSRRAKPIVLVDCGAITASLIESELFGHEKGAFTGAEQTRSGRLAEADGGTVFLDEIGELPLAVQSKLLRFVQERHFTPVGGTRERQVEVRVVAATNRVLAEEVSAGRFRADLFHRLNVVTLSVPPLRERPADILPLAHYFLETFSTQYQKDVHSFTAETERLLLQYSWPGNVRELQNRLMQAVLLCQGGKLAPDELQLEHSALVGRDAAHPTRRSPNVSEDTNGASVEALWDELRQALARQTVRALERGRDGAQPLGKWLVDDLLLEAREAAGGSGRRGAALVGLPPSSFQRRVSKAAGRERAGLARRGAQWEEVRRILSELVVRASADGSGLLERAEEVLLDEINKCVPGDARTGAALLGVTTPTFRRRLGQLD